MCEPENIGYMLMRHSNPFMIAMPFELSVHKKILYIMQFLLEKTDETGTTKGYTQVRYRVYIVWYRELIKLIGFEETDRLQSMVNCELPY